MNATTTNDSTALWRIASHLCALAVAVFFIYAAWGKIGPAETRQFAVEIGNYKILDPAFVNIPAIIMPWIEIFAAIALIVPATRKSGAILIGGMLLFFIGAVFYSAIILDLKISCGCTGAGSGKAGWSVIGRNALLLTATVLSVALLRPKLAVAARRGFDVDVTDGATA